jgi:hypothetical protein
MAVVEGDCLCNVFICAAGHSGSTLLDMILGSHTAAESIGEVINLPMDMATNNACACGCKMRECGLWPFVMRRMGVDPDRDPYGLNLGYAMPTIGDPVLTSPLHRALTRPKIALRYCQLRYGVPLLSALTPGFSSGIANTLALYDHVRALTGKRAIVDSTKHYVRAAAIYLAQPERTRIVVLVRDGRGVFYSGLKHGFGRARAVRAWSNHYRRTLALLERHVPAAHQTVVHYEDLVTDPTKTLSRLCDFLGLPWEPAMLDFRAVTHHNVNGNLMKLASTSALRLDDAWKTQLAEEDLRYFERRAGELNRKLGYD